MSLPLTQDDVARWMRRRANSLTLEIPEKTPADLTGLTELGGLLHLHIGGNSRSLVSFDQVLPTLNRLESLAVNLRNYAISDVPQWLRDLRLTPYRSVGVDLSGAKLKSLWVDGIGGLTDLRWLEGASIKQLVIQHAPKLGSLKGIPADVTSLRVDFAGRLSDLDALRGMPLRSLELHRCGSIRLPPGIEEHISELMLNESGKVVSLSMLSGARGLKRLEFYGSTAIEDGRVAFLGELRGLADVRFQNRKTYDSTREEIWARLSKRRGE